jgi:hypothetical protein
LRNLKEVVRLFYVFGREPREMQEFRTGVGHTPVARGFILAVFRHLVEADKPVAFLDQGGTRSADFM